MPDDTTILSLPLILPAQAQKHVTHNEALVALDLIVQLTVINRTLTTAPALPSVGDRHIVAAGATGPWAGQSGRIALFSETGWQFTPGLPGWRAHVLAEDQTAVFDGVAWKTPSESPLTVPQLGVAAAADAVNRLTVAAPATLLTHAGSGHQLKVNKAAAADTASLLFQTGFSGRAEMGTAGSEAFGIKVSANGSAWFTALQAAPATGEVTLPAPMRLGGQASDPASPVNGTFWLNTTTGEVKVRSAGATLPLGGGAGVSDGDKGDITVSGSGAVWTVDPGAITLAKLASVPTDVFLGRDTAGTGAPEVMTPTQARGLLNVSDGATANATDAALRDRATHTGLQVSTTISDFAEAVDDRVAALLVAGANVTLSYNDAGNALTIAAAGGGGATNLSYDSATRTVISDTGSDAVLPLMSGAAAGLVPASGGGTTTFLRADGTFAAPPGGGAGTDLSYVSATRTLESSTGADVTLPLVSNTTAGLMPAPETGPARLHAFHDMLAPTNSAEFTFQQGGTGAGAVARVGIADGGVGWVNFNLGTAATNRAACATQDTMMLGSGRAAFACRMRQLTVSDATTTYTERFGFIDSVTGESVDGAFFRYTHSVNGGRFQAVTRANNVETAVDTGITVTVNATYRLEIAVNAGGTSAEFRIDGNLVATITTTLPVAAGRETGAGLMLLRSVGTAAATPVTVDYISLELALTAAR